MVKPDHIRATSSTPAPLSGEYLGFTCATFQLAGESEEGRRAWRWRGEIIARQIGLAGLVEELAAIGFRKSRSNLHNKISRAGFTGAFLVQCLRAMGFAALRLDD